MAKKARQRISYVLENAKSSAGGHRLGVNGLAVDASNGILYSGGRDGIVCAWDLNLDDGPRDRATRGHDNASAPPPRPTTRLRAQAQAHMHWINDVALAQNNAVLVSASSDLAVKVWRPHSEEDNTRAQTIGEHADYVKCVATPPADMGANWVASGGLDRKIRLWDLNGAGKTLEVDVKGEDMSEKGSVYALAVGRNILASGGPEKTVRLYDPRTGSRVSKLVGHLDNIRSILIDDAGDIILSASADKTIKMWSVKGGRCMYTFTMHDESIWSLHSDHPRLGIFYSSDRSGLVAKTDVQGSLEDMDHGLSLAVAQEHFGVSKVVAARGHIWTATNHSSINRWGDVNTSGCHAKLAETFRHHKAAWPRQPSLFEANPPNHNNSYHYDADSKDIIPPESMLRISSTAVFPARGALDPESTMPGEALTRRASEVVADQPDPEARPIHQLPEETIEGQFGLLKHKMLNDRRRVLTLDTAGDVLLWDLIACKPIRSFGKQHLEDVEKVVNTREAVAPWCSVDLSSGNLTVVLDPFNCFDAEIYADDLALGEPGGFKEDQRISLGRWILRYLFDNLVDEEVKRDQLYRQRLNEDVVKKLSARRPSAPTSIDFPPPSMLGWDRFDQATTPRPNGSQLPALTPGLGIGLATPGSAGSLPGVREEYAAGPPERARPGDRDGHAPADGTPKAQATASTETTEAKHSTENGNDRGKEKEKATDSGKQPGTPFGRKFRMSFSSRKLGRSWSQATQEKPVVVEDKAEESESSSNHDKEVDDSFFGVIQKMRNEYEKQLVEAPGKLVETRITPSLPTETPVLKLPPGTKIIIQEETSGGSASVYQGTVENTGRDADIIEQKAPMWLGDLLLQNQIPHKDPVKISFVLYPMDDLPPISPADGTNRLNANRMLRVKKILAYVAERIEEQPAEEGAVALMAEEYMELYCNDQLLAPSMSLAAIRTHVWKGGNDIVLYYRANGRKEMKFVQHASSSPAAEGDGAAAQAPAAVTAAPETSNGVQTS